MCNAGCERRGKNAVAKKIPVPESPAYIVSAMSRLQRIELLLFTACLFAFAYFNQGGGWNQNARFAEVRAMVEEGRFAIDHFLVYRRDPAGDNLKRIPVDRAEYALDGKRFRLAWVDMEWNLYPVGDEPMAAGVEKAPMVELCASGDIGFVPHTGHFHPNKPPGTSFLGVPGYFVIYWIEKLLGINPDHWWSLNVNAWLTSVCSVGVISALGCVLFFRLARDFANAASTPALLATLALAFGTTFFPFATLLFDHNLTASLLVGAFYFLRRVAAGAVPALGFAGTGRLDQKRWNVQRADVTPLVLAGLCAGLAAITNYIAAIAVIFLALYALLAPRHVERPVQWGNTVCFGIGVFGPFLLICWYNWVCFGSPFKLSNDFQNPLFKDPHGLLGMFVMPSSYIAAVISISPFRGLFFLAPILILGVAGLFVWLREKRFVAEARLCLAIFGFFFLVNASFNGYHGGFSAGPRYLIPGIPFLALPLVVAFARWKAIALTLLTISIAFQLLLTATDAQNPLAVGGHARNDRRQDFANNLITHYAWPLFAHGRAWPLLDEILEVHLEKEKTRLAAEIDDPAEVERVLNEERRSLREGILRGDQSPFLLASVEGPVSVNPVGVFEGLFTYSFYLPRTVQTRSASFNLGEFIWPQSRWSLLPLLVITGGLSVVALFLSRAEDLSSRTSSTARPQHPKP